jgi:hypothetical protein
MRFDQNYTGIGTIMKDGMSRLSLGSRAFQEGLTCPKKVIISE